MHATLNAFLDSKMTVTLDQAGEQFALRLKSDKEGTLLVWLSKDQLNALGFAVEVAQQEAEQAAYLASDRCHKQELESEWLAEDFAGANYYPEGGPDGDENSFRPMCRHGHLRRECETCDYEAAAEAFAQP